MQKILKIVGAVILGIIVLFLILSFFLGQTAGRSSMTNTTSIGMPGSGDDLGSAAGISSQSVNFSSPMSFGAGGTMEKSVDSSLNYAAPSPSYVREDVSQDLSQTDKKIIKDGDLSLKVDSADDAASKISAIAKENGGEVFSSNFYQSTNNVKSGTVTVKVPVANFEKTFSEIKNVASLVIRESSSGQDVTEQYVDLEAQLKNAKAEEESFLKILGQAQKVQDVLDVTRELSRVRGNIEQLQARIKYLDSQTDMSTISANLTEDANITVVDSWRPLQVVKESFTALIKSLQGFVDFLIQFFIVALPFIIIWALIIWLAYKVGKKIYDKVKNRQQGL